MIEILRWDSWYNARSKEKVRHNTYIVLLTFHYFYMYWHDASITSNSNIVSITENSPSTLSQIVYRNIAPFVAWIFAPTLKIASILQMSKVVNCYFVNIKNEASLELFGSSLLWISWKNLLKSYEEQNFFNICNTND